MHGQHLIIAILTLAACLGEPPLAPFVFVDGDDLDGERNATLVPGAIAAVVDHGTHGEALTQATTSKKPAFAPACLGAHDCIVSDGIDYVAKSTAADWTFLHSGAGATVYVVSSWDEPVGDTTTFTVHTGGGVNPGVGVGIDNRTVRGANLARLLVGPGILDTDHDTPDDTLPTGGFRIVSARIVDNVGPTADGVVRVDGIQVNAEPATSTWSSSAPLNALRVGAIKGKTMAVLIYDAAHTVEQMRAIEDWLRCRYFAPPPHNATFYGDSLCAIRAPIKEWPRKVKEVGVAPFEVENRCARGYTAAQVAAYFDAFDYEQQQRYGILTVEAGTNDALDGLSGADAFADLEALWSTVRPRTALLVAVTVPPLKGASGWTQAKHAELVALNALILGSPIPDAVLDVYALVVDPLDPERIDPAYSLDSIHLNETGTSLVADAWIDLTGAP